MGQYLRYRRPKGAGEIGYDNGELLQKRGDDPLKTVRIGLNEGVVSVLVNGRLAIDQGQLTSVAAGQPLLRTPKAGTCPV